LGGVQLIGISFLRFAHIAEIRGHPSAGRSRSTDLSREKEKYCAKMNNNYITEFSEVPLTQLQILLKKSRSKNQAKIFRSQKLCNARSGRG
jgi:hypothetical protein